MDDLTKTQSGRTDEEQKQFDTEIAALDRIAAAFDEGTAEVEARIASHVRHLRPTWEISKNRLLLGEPPPQKRKLFRSGKTTGDKK